MVKAIELFNNDIGRYPMISNGVMTCPQADKTEVSCNGLIYAYLGNTRAIYMEKVPTDPDSGKKYVYVPDTNELVFPCMRHWKILRTVTWWWIVIISQPTGE